MTDIENLKRIPSNIEAEKSVLCGILLAPTEMGEILEILKPDHFYKNAHKHIYQAMCDVYAEGINIDTTIVVDRLKKNGKYVESGGDEVMADILSAVVTPANMKAFASIVKDAYVMRKIGEAGTKMVELAYGEYEDSQTVLDKAESMIFRIAENTDSNSVVSIKEALPEEFNRLEKVIKNKGSVGVTSGYVAVDKMTNGFQDSDLIIIAARPSMGKTALALNFALNAAKKSESSVLIFSLEMSKSQLIDRFIAIEAGIPLSNLRGGYLEQKDYIAMGDAMGSLGRANIFIADTAMTNVLEIRSIARKLKTQSKLDLIIIDYLQLINGTRGRGESREQEISAISRALKGIAKDLNIPIIALSQLSRAVESRGDRRPMLSDLRESGAIEQDADVVMFLYRDEYYDPDTEDKGVVEVIIGKQRNGPTGTARLRFFNELTRFNDLEDEGRY